MTIGERNLIIGGSAKCGTTSLFRYLGAHPAVCLSSTKEASFFYEHQNLESSALRNRYRKLFPTENAQTTLFVEASPTYLHGGQRIAEHIHRIFPNALLLFLLRNPARRLTSHYKSRFGQLDSHVGLTVFDSFVRLGRDSHGATTGTPTRRQGAFRQEFTMGRYADFLPSFLKVFGVSRVGIFFFEDMVADTRRFINSACDFVGLDREPYTDYDFTVENKTRYHRSASLREIATYFNERFEPFLNQTPIARRSLRWIYNLANSKSGDEITIDSKAYNAVVEYYQEPNRRLAELLKETYPDKELPEWLHKQ